MGRGVRPGRRVDNDELVRGLATAATTREPRTAHAPLTASVSYLSTSLNLAVDPRFSVASRGDAPSS